PAEGLRDLQSSKRKDLFQPRINTDQTRMENDSIFLLIRVPSVFHPWRMAFLFRGLRGAPSRDEAAGRGGRPGRPRPGPRLRPGWHTPPPREGAPSRTRPFPGEDAPLRPRAPSRRAIPPRPRAA